MKYYRSLKFCKIFNFFESIEDVRYLLVLDDYMELPELMDTETKELEGAKEILFSEYNGHTRHGNDILFDTNKSLIRLLADQNFILQSLFILRRKYKEPSIDFGGLEKTLGAMGYGLNYSNELEFYNEILRLEKRAASKNSQITRRQKEIEDILKLNNKNNKKSGYMSAILKIEMHTNIKMDIYNDTMIKFVDAQNLFIETIKLKKQLNKKAA